MLLALIASVSLCATSPATPAPASPQMRTIEHVTVSALCSTLRRNIAQTVTGLRANDGLIRQGAAMMMQIRSDAANEPRSDSPTGGAGAGSEMDDYALGQLVNNLAQNLERIEALLADPHAFPSHATTDAQRALLATKTRLEAVAAQQRKTLDILSATVLSNAATDLASRCDPVDCPKGGSAPVRMSPARALAAQVAEEQISENQVAPAVVAVIDLCRKVQEQP